MAAPKIKPEPGPKPEFLVVEHSLHAQTEEGEIVLDLRLPIPKLELFMKADEMEPMAVPRFLLDELLDPADSQRLQTLKDGAKGFQIVMKWAEAVGAKLGASLGESVSSTDSSESTEEPSGMTSGPGSA